MFYFANYMEEQFLQNRYYFNSIRNKIDTLADIKFKLESKVNVFLNDGHFLIEEFGTPLEMADE